MKIDKKPTLEDRIAVLEQEAATLKNHLKTTVMMLELNSGLSGRSPLSDFFYEVDRNMFDTVPVNPDPGGGGGLPPPDPRPATCWSKCVVSFDRARKAAGDDPIKLTNALRDFESCKAACNRLDVVAPT